VEDRRLRLACACAAPALIVVIGVGLVGFAGMVPPPSPSDSPEKIKRFFVDGQDGIRVGMVLIMVGGAGFIPWASGLANELKRALGSSSLATHIQLGGGVIACVVATSFAMVGSLAAFRPDHLAAETTRLLDDLLWFWWLIPWPAFTVWCVLVGCLILSERNPGELFPRWSGYLSIWAAVCYVPGSLAIFFTTGGAFSYNGLVVWYVPTVVFFIWMACMTPLMFRAIAAEGKAVPA